MSYPSMLVSSITKNHPITKNHKLLLLVKLQNFKVPFLKNTL